LIKGVYGTVNKVSMCVLFYNHERFVRQALDGCFNQSIDSYDLIIRDDASTDNTQKEITDYLASNGFSKGKLIVDLDTTNRGLIPSFNRVLELSEGDIIVSQGGDDISMSKRIERSLEILERYSVDLISADAIVIDSNGTEINNTWYRKQFQNPFGKFGSSVEGGNCTIIKNPTDFQVYTISYAGFGFAFRKSLLGNGGTFPEGLPFEDFYLTFLANVNNGSAVLYEPLVNYRRHDSNMFRTGFRKLNDYVQWRTTWTRKYIDVVKAQMKYLDQNESRIEKDIAEIRKELYLSIAFRELDLSVLEVKDLKERFRKLNRILFNKSVVPAKKAKSFVKCLFPKYYLRYQFKKSNNLTNN